MSPSRSSLDLQPQAGCASTGGDQQVQHREPSSPPPPCTGMAHDSFRLSFPFTLFHALTGLVAMLVIRVHDAS
jgi:hypothetical protein